MAGRWQDAVEIVVELGVGVSRQPPASSAWDAAVWDVDEWAALEPYWRGVPCTEVGSVATRRGRGRPWEAFDAGTLSLNLLDEAGRYTFQPATPIDQVDLRTGSPIRVSARFAGATYPLFRGYVENVVETFDADYPQVALGAQDALAQLARQALAERPPAGDGELAHVRIGRILDAAAWPVEWRTITPGVTPQMATPFGTNALDEAAEVAFGEGGLFYALAAGNVAFHGQTWLLENPRSTIVQLEVGNQPGAACPARIDVSRNADDLVNDVYLARLAPGAVVQHARDDVSVGLYGLRTEPQLNLWLASDVDVADRATLLLEERAGTATDTAGHPVDRIRVDSVEVNAGTVDRWPTLLALDVGDRVHVHYTHPRHGWTWDTVGVVQWVAHNVTLDAWTVTFGVDEVAQLSSSAARWDTAAWDVDQWTVV